MNKKSFWGIVPTLIIDREKYKGRGRPRKDDYRVFPHPDGRDFHAVTYSKADEKRQRPFGEDSLIASYRYEMAVKLLPKQKGFIVSTGDMTA